MANLVHVLRACLFVLFMLTPSVDLLFAIDGTTLGDEGVRVHQEAGLKTAHSVSEWFGRFRAYLRTIMGFRGSLVRAHGLLKVHGFGVPSSPRVALGTEGWLYLTDQGTLDDCRRTVRLSAERLRAYQRVLLQRKRWLAERGVEYAFFFAPDKQTIYPEHLPAHAVPVAGLPSSLDQFHHAVGDLALDLRPALRDAAGSLRLYHLTDTHWNELGGLIAARALARQFAPMRERSDRLDADRTIILRSTGAGGDLARMLGLKYDLHEVSWDVRFAGDGERSEQGGLLRIATIDVQAQPRFRVFNQQAPSGKALFLRDSFGEAMIRPVAQLFRETLFVRTSEFDRALIEEERPLVVIQELVERRVSSYQPR